MVRRSVNIPSGRGPQPPKDRESLVLAVYEEAKFAREMNPRSHEDFEMRESLAEARVNRIDERLGTAPVEALKETYLTADKKMARLFDISANAQWAAGDTARYDARMIEGIEKLSAHEFDLFLAHTGVLVAEQVNASQKGSPAECYDNAMRLTHGDCKNIDSAIAKVTGKRQR